MTVFFSSSVETSYLWQVIFASVLPAGFARIAIVLLYSLSPQMNTHHLQFFSGKSYNACLRQKPQWLSIPFFSYSHQSCHFFDMFDIAIPFNNFVVSEVLRSSLTNRSTSGLRPLQAKHLCSIYLSLILRQAISQRVYRAVKLMVWSRSNPSRGNCKERDSPLQKPAIIGWIAFIVMIKSIRAVCVKVGASQFLESVEICVLVY